MDLRQIELNDLIDDNKYSKLFGGKGSQAM